MVTLSITGERLMAMYDNDMNVYATPGDSTPYWASHPSFMYDECVLTAAEMIEDVAMREGLDEEDLRSDATDYEFEVALLPARTQKEQ